MFKDMFYVQTKIKTSNRCRDRKIKTSNNPFRKKWALTITYRCVIDQKRIQMIERSGLIPA